MECISQKLTKIICRIFIIAAMFVGAMAYCFDYFRLGGRGHTYFVLVEAVPQNINLSLFEYDRTAFVGYQIHDPMLKIGSNGAYSDVLSSWSANVEYNAYELCLRSNLRFSDGSLVSIVDLDKNLRRMEAERLLTVPIQNVIYNSMCVKVTFHQAYTAFLSQLTSARSAIVKVAEDGGVVAGLGQYRFTKMSSDYAELKYIGSESPYFDKVALVTPRYVEAHDLTNIQDLNNVSANIRQKFIGPNIKKNRQIIPNMTYLLLGVRDKKIRRAISTCFNKDRYIEAVSGDLLASYKYYRADSFFPRALGANRSMISKRRCQPYAGHNAKLNIIHFYPDIKKKLAGFYRELSETSNVDIRLRIRPHALLKLPLATVAREYDGVAIGESGLNPMAYLALFLSNNKNQFGKFASKKLQKLFAARSSKEDGALILENPLIELGIELELEDFAVPLYELEKYFYLDRSISPPKFEIVGGISLFKIEKLEPVGIL